MLGSWCYILDFMKILILLLCFAISVFNCHAVEDLDGNNEGKVRVLIIDGFNNHDWKKSTEAVLSILSRDVSLITDVSTVPQLPPFQSCSSYSTLKAVL